MACSKLQKLENLSEDELFRQAEYKIFGRDHPMTILYRFHKLPHRRIHNSHGNDDCFEGQDFVLNLKRDSSYTLCQAISCEEKGCCFDNNWNVKEKADDENKDTLDMDNYEVKLVGDCYSKYVDTSRHCRIVKKKSGLWIMDLGSEFGTFINGAKLQLDLAYCLKTGDVISLGFPFTEGQSWILECGHYWVFKFREMPESEFENRNELAEQVFSNPVILNSIFSYAESATLNDCRLVSKKWLEASKQEMRHRCCILLNLSIHPTINDKWRKDIEAEVESIRNIGIRSIKFRAMFYDQDLPKERLELLENLLSEFGSKITSIEFELDLLTPNLVLLFKTLISQYKKLEVVTFKELSSKKNLENEKVFQFGSNFCANSSVRILRFKKFRRSFCEILSLFPNTTEIELMTDDAAEKFFNEIRNQPLEKIKVLRLNSESRNCYYVDSELRVFDACYFSRYFFSLSKGTLDNLATLEINDFRFSCPNNVNHLYKLCSKLRKTLKILNLGLIIEEENYIIKFPKMETLNSLKLTIQEHADEELIGIKFSSAVISPGFGSNVFPHLEHLNIQLEEKTMNCGEFIERHFGSDADLRNEAVLQVRFVFQNEKDKDQFSVLAENKFAESFPNKVNLNFQFKK